jgi:hypothetical protein
VRSRRLMSLVAVTVIAIICSSVLATTSHSKVVNDKRDPISGEWDVMFELQGTRVPGRFNLKLDGNVVTGSAESEHTGPGTLRDGKWADNKISFTLDFATHESIAVTGTVKDGKLIGEFQTEGMQGTWEAKRR